MVRVSLVAAMVLAAGLAWSGQAQAFRLVPIEMEFAPSGRNATQIFRLDNDRNEPAAIEIRMMARSMTPDGEDKLSPAEDQFAIYPEQIVLMPGQSQSVRVQWLGNPKPPAELPFRLIAEQLPVDLGKTPPQGGQVRLLVRYVASVYIMPPGVKPDLKVMHAGPTTEQGKQALELVVANHGTSREILRDAQLTLTAGGKTVTLKGPAMKGIAGENVLAGGERRFVLPWPAGLGAGAVTARLTVPQ